MMIKKILPLFCTLLCLVACDLFETKARRPDVRDFPMHWSREVGNLQNNTGIVLGQIIGIHQTGNGLDAKFYLASYDLDTGNQLWKHSIAAPPFADKRFVIYENTIFYNDNFELLIVSADGTLQKRYNFAEKSRGKTVSATLITLDRSNEILYLTTFNTLYALDVREAVNPKLLWTKTYPETRTWSMQATDEGHLLVGLDGRRNKSDFNLVKLSKSGETLWQIRADEVPNILPDWYIAPNYIEIENNHIYVASLERMQSFDLATGKQQWVSPDFTKACNDSSNRIDDFLIHEDSIYLSPTVGSCIFSIDKLTGKLNWTLSSREDTFATFGGEPAIKNGVVYVSDGFLWAIDAKTGKKLARSSDFDRGSHGAFIKATDDAILVWGSRLRSFKPFVP